MTTIEIKNDTISPGLARLAARLSDLSPVMQDIGEILVVSTKQRFPQGISPQGVPWAPKSPVTLAAYGARKSNRVDVRPLFGPSGALSSTIAADPGPDSVMWGSNMIYAAMQQFGGTKAQFPNLWGNIPARPFLGISDQDETNILEAIDEWLSGAVNAGV